MSSINNYGITSLLASRIHGQNAIGLLKSMHSLATGQRINRGADDPAGLIISERLRAMLMDIDAESRMLQRTEHVARSADGALNEVSSLINEAQALIVANANSAGMSDEERLANQMQIDSILNSINNIAGSATFNGQRLLDGTLTLSANGQSISLEGTFAHNLGSVEIDGQIYTLANLGTNGALNANPEAAQQVLSAAREQVASMRGRLGAFQKHTVESRINSLGTMKENIAAANSLIRDTDYARETANFTRLLLLQHSSMKMIGLINNNASSVLKLLA